MFIDLSFNRLENVHSAHSFLFRYDISNRRKPRTNEMIGFYSLIYYFKFDLKLILNSTRFFFLSRDHNLSGFKYDSIDIFNGILCDQYQKYKEMKRASEREMKYESVCSCCVHSKNPSKPFDKQADKATEINKSNLTKGKKMSLKQKMNVSDFKKRKKDHMTKI